MSSPRARTGRSDPSLVTLLLVTAAALVPVAACGSGPTDSPRTPEKEPIQVGGVRGLPVTTADPNGGGGNGGGPGGGAGSAEAERARARAALAESRRVADDETPEVPAAEAGPDPMRGTFSLAQAVAGLPASGPLVATIKTSKGDMKCKLFDDKAPIATSNFVGLARGTRPFKDPKGRWVTRPAYDGTNFHRVIKGFMIQGGDPQGTGRGEPGYVFKDELWTGLGSKHDRPGLLCMANRGPDTNGMQFFITDAAAAHLDRSYTIFGECSPVSVVHAIANVATDGTDRPTSEVTIDKVEISRGGVVAPPPKDASGPAGGTSGTTKESAKDAGAPSEAGAKP